MCEFFLYIVEGVFVLIELIGMLAAVLTTFAFFPQVVKTVKTKSTDDLSWTWLIMMIAGVFFWLVYGVFIESLSLVSANAVTLCSVVILFWVKYSNHRNTEFSKEE